MQLVKLCIHDENFEKSVLTHHKRIEGEQKKKETNVLCHTVKMIDPRLKSQARGQNNRSRAIKSGIVHHCNLNSLRDMI